MIAITPPPVLSSKVTDNSIFEKEKKSEKGSNHNSKASKGSKKTIKEEGEIVENEEDDGFGDLLLDSHHKASSIKPKLKEEPEEERSELQSKPVPKPVETVSDDIFDGDLLL